jgi:hypothetical protein
VKTIIKERIPGNHTEIKRLDKLIPFLPEGTSISIEDMSYQVHSYSVAIDEAGEVTAYILVK